VSDEVRIEKEVNYANKTHPPGRGRHTKAWDDVHGVARPKAVAEVKIYGVRQAYGTVHISETRGRSDPTSTMANNG
jgi:hypothetical protein